MRQFSVSEKSIVERIVAPFNNVPPIPLPPIVKFDDLIDDISARHNGLITIPPTHQVVQTIKVTTSGDNARINFIVCHKMSYDVINTVNFLDYLSKNDLIYFIMANGMIMGFLAAQNIGNVVARANSDTKTISDGAFVEKVKSFYNKEIYPTQTLIDYFNQHYKTEEEIRHNENLDISNKSLKATQDGLKLSDDSLQLSSKSIELSIAALKDSKTNLLYARIALVSAIGFSLFGMYSNYKQLEYTKTALEQSQTTIDSVQFKTVQSQLKSLENVDKKLDSIVKLLKPKDNTLKKPGGIQNLK
ncbi:MAG: hypothetical protein NT040_05520 [Bacteroidetes bacterium]|nr:hypothetical protein [Bacteroidota bacterium]